MKRTRTLGFLLLVFCHRSSGAFADEKPVILKRAARLGIVFCYPGRQPVRSFLKSNPCVSGAWWRCHKETKQYWIGELHYPTENTANYRPAKGKPRSPRYYMVTNLRIRKRAGLPIDMRRFRGALVLKDPNPNSPLSIQGDETLYELVGFQDLENKTGKSTHLFATHPELRYAPKPPKRRRPAG